MKKIILFIAIIIIILVGGFFWLNNYVYVEKQGVKGFQKGYKDSSYIIEGREITFINGFSEIQTAQGSASKIITKYFGNEAEGDLNSDGVSDIVFLLTQEGGGSGILVNYTDRKANEPMTTSPSIGVSKYFKVSGNILAEINKDIVK